MNINGFYTGIEAWRSVPFDWETANCCHFVADMLKRTTGRVVDIPTVTSEDGMREWLTANGHRSLYHAAVAHLGKGVKPMQARRGDILWRASDGALGVCDRQGLFLSRRGLVHIPLTQCTRALRHG